ncbi:hypothetical protein [Streptomyces sp. NPDC015131]|uniref:hypothetical protein n=1 Tax=Streptomyces sp. NPDC015131 TaxID=3364941 RepID=UPI0036F6BE86
MTYTTYTGGGLRHSGGPWTSASGTAGELRTRTETSRGSLRPAHGGLGPDAGALASVAALKTVLTSWEERLTAVRDECGHLAGALSRVARDLGETDIEVGRSFHAAARKGDPQR